MTKLAYSIDEAAEALGISRGSLYLLMNDGQIRTIRVGARRIVPASALAEFLGGAA